MLLEENCKFINQTLQYSNEFNHFIVCHHKLPFRVTMTLILFSTPPPPHNVLQTCHATFKGPIHAPPSKPQPKDITEIDRYTLCGNRIASSWSMATFIWIINFYLLLYLYQAERWGDGTVGRGLRDQKAPPSQPQSKDTTEIDRYTLQYRSGTNFQLFQNIPEYSQIFTNIFEYFLIYLNTLEYFVTSWNTLE